MKFCSI